MPRSLRVSASILLLVTAGCTADVPAETGATETPGSVTEATLLSALADQVETARGKFVQMARAVPEESWDYRPMDGVRSFGEVFIHVAADNWVPLWMGLEVTTEAPIEATVESLMAYQATARPREETVAELERSFDFLLEALARSEGQLDRTVDFGGEEWGLGELWVGLTTHMHEHLGQTIAYARANEIVPPWSR